MRTERGNQKPRKWSLVRDHAISYCETTTIHGFSYWVSAPRLPERIFWVCLVLAFASYAGVIVLGAIREWVESPVVTEIKTFSKVMTVWF